MLLPHSLGSSPVARFIRFKRVWQSVRRCSSVILSRKAVTLALVFLVFSSAMGLLVATVLVRKADEGVSPRILQREFREPATREVVLSGVCRPLSGLMDNCMAATWACAPGYTLPTCFAGWYNSVAYSELYKQISGASSAMRTMRLNFKPIFSSTLIELAFSGFTIASNC